MSQSPSSLQRRPNASLVLIFTLLAAAGCTPEATELDVGGDLDAIRTAEDRRDSSPAALAPILERLGHPLTNVRMTAVRAIGRFEDPSLLPLIASALSDPDPAVRAEAANAVGQAARNEGWAQALDTLATRLDGEEDPLVRAVFGQTIGRLGIDDPEAHARAEGLLRALLEEDADGLDSAASTERLLALSRGFESLARRGRALRPLDPTTRAILTPLTRHGLEREVVPQPADSRIRRIRQTSLMAYLAGGSGVDPAVLAAALDDPDGEVRRVAARGLAALADPGPLMARALQDPAAPVRWEAVRIAGTGRDRNDCRALIAAVDDPDGHVAVLALDLLAEACPQASAQMDALQRVAASGDGGPWHRSAHATLSLSTLAPQESADAVARLSGHDNGFARAWGARAAAARGDRALLTDLLADGDPNVRTAALQGIAELAGRAADQHAIDQLGELDPQLVMTAADLLEGTNESVTTLPVLVDALTRFTAMERETSRDVRIALLRRIRETGGPEEAGLIEPFLLDFDAQVAEVAAQTLSEWTGGERAAAPRPLPSQSVPTSDEVGRLARSSVVLEMEGGGLIEVRLLPTLAPTNAARFARLATSGYFDGLTFHRVAPNFVIQGGSPGANEYWGDGPFSRDELGLVGNWRGTVGLSTRGRDTGDAQIYVNLVNNLRLDHDYTIMGEVTRGMEVLDAVMEGNVIVSARVVEIPEL
jgi:cyclophilin family peptidyl-prolyl cis-trans isomerase/HEAT repeat protein